MTQSTAEVYIALQGATGTARSCHVGGQGREG